MRLEKILCTLTAVGLLGGCTALSEIHKTGVKSDPVPHTEPFTDSSAHDENTKLVHEFMDALVSHDTETAARIGGCQTLSAYEFLEGVKFTEWKLLGTDGGGDGTVYRICLNIAESSAGTFPVGESEWTLEISESEDEYFSSFSQTDGQERTVLDDNVSALDVSDAVKMCYAFTSEFGWVSSDDSIIDISGAEKIVEKERFISDLIRFCSYFSNDPELSESIMDYPAEKLSESAEKLLGIEDLDFSSLPSYNKAKDTVSDKRTRFCWGYAALADEQYDSESGIHKITIDWYSDTLLLAKAKTIEYVLTDNPDGSIRLCSTEKLFDNGEPIAFFTRSIY